MSGPYENPNSGGGGQNHDASHVLPQGCATGLGSRMFPSALVLSDFRTQRFPGDTSKYSRALVGPSAGQGHVSPVPALF